MLSFPVDSRISGFRDVLGICAGACGRVWIYVDLWGREESVPARMGWTMIYYWSGRASIHVCERSPCLHARVTDQNKFAQSPLTHPR